MSRKCVQYCRCSTDGQDLSIDLQLKLTKEFADKNGCAIIAPPYTDEGFTGVETENRPAFMSMINLIQSGAAPFEYIIVYKANRWSRSQNENEAKYWEFICNQHGVEVVYTNIGFTKDNEFVANIQKSLEQLEASKYSKDLSGYVTDGMRYAAEQGFWLSIPPYGYARAEVDGAKNIVRVLRRGEGIATKGHHAILVKGDESEIDVVRRIFEWNKHGLGLKKIAERLNGSKIIGPGGKLWDVSNIHRILTREVYAGIYVWGKHKGGSISRSSNSWGDTNKSPNWHDKNKWVVKPGLVPAIIDMETFEKVQRGLRERSFVKNPGKGKPYGSEYLLHGLLYCETCGGRCVGQSNYGKSRKTPALQYACSTRVKFGVSSCDSGYFSRKGPDEFVLETILGFCKDPGFRKLVKQKMRDRLIKEIDYSRDEQKIKREIAKIEKGIKTLLDRIEDPNNSNWEIANERITERRQEIERLNAELRSVQEQGRTADSVEKLIYELDKRFADAATYLTDTKRGDDEINELKKMIVRQFLHKAVVSSDRSHITFYFYAIPRISPEPNTAVKKIRRVLPVKHKSHKHRSQHPGLDLNPEDYQVVTLDLKQDMIEEDGKRWYRYQPYAKLKKVNYSAVVDRVHRGVVITKVIRGERYICDLPYNIKERKKAR